jgi:hypothetical protein
MSTTSTSLDAAPVAPAPINTTSTTNTTPLNAPLIGSNLAPPFTVQQSTLPSGTVVREYVDANSTVFAVTWDGPAMPDLRSLFGDTYFSQYVRSARATAVNRNGRGPMLVNQPTLVVQSSGRMRAFFGKAYVPQLLPRGVTVDQIQ